MAWGQRHIRQVNRSAVRDLLSDWIYVSYSQLWDSSSDIQRDTFIVIASAKDRAERIGLAWDHDIIPPVIRDALVRWSSE